VGAGLGMSAGLPSWHDMTENLAYILGRRVAEQSPPLEDLLQELVQLRGPDVLQQEIVSAIPTPSLQRAHRALVNLPWLFVIVTGFDEVIEAACAEVGREIRLISSVDDIASLNVSEVGVLREFPAVRQWRGLI